MHKFSCDGSKGHDQVPPSKMAPKFSGATAQTGFGATFGVQKNPTLQRVTEEKYLHFGAPNPKFVAVYYKSSANNLTTVQACFSISEQGPAKVTNQSCRELQGMVYLCQPTEHVHLSA